jgi:hypothetical protein
MVGDGGGRGAVREPVRGQVQVARFLAGLWRYAEREDLTVVAADVNGQPGAIVYAPDGSVGGVLSLDVVDGRIATVRSVVNPEKLRHIPDRHA